MRHDELAQLGSADSKSYGVKEVSDCLGLEWFRKTIKNLELSELEQKPNPLENDWQESNYNTNSGQAEKNKKQKILQRKEKEKAVSAVCFWKQRILSSYQTFKL